MFTQNTYSQTDTLNQIFKDTFNLETIEIIAPDEIKYEKKNNTYEFDVSGTKFEKQINLTQSLNLLPQLSIQNNEIKFANQKCIIEINGQILELPADEIVNVLNSIDPSQVSKIYITTNSYKYGNKSTVINIKTKNLNKQYRVSVQTTHGSRYNYFNDQSIQSTFRVRSIQNMNSMKYNITPYFYSGDISKVTPFDNISTSYNEKDNRKKLNIFNQLSFNITPKISLIFNDFYSNNQINNNSLSFTKIQSIRQTTSSVKNESYYAENSVNFDFSDSSKLNISGLFYNRNEKQTNSETYFDTLSAGQIINSRLPYIRLNADFTLLKPYFNLYSGIKVYQLNSFSDNILNNINRTKFKYHEQSVRAYVTIEKNFGNISLNLNVANEYINLYNTLNLNDTPNTFQYHLNIPLVNLNCNWETSKKWYHSISLNNDVLKPNYSNFNSIKSISNELYYSVGSQNMKPALAYQLNYSLSNQTIFLSTNLSYVKNYISNMLDYDSHSNQILNTYKNFNQIYSADISISYNKELIPNFWFLKSMNTLMYINIKDNNYQIHPTTPMFSSELIQYFLINNIQIGLNYYFNSDFYDGLIYHNLSHYINFVLSYTINKQFKVFLEINDPLKTNRDNQIRTLLPNYIYQSRIYYDYKFFSIQIKYTLQSKNFKKSSITQDENEIKRFD
ncbi:MAG: hypothetical protein Fur0023_13200 [Bacteroidia bacterium]